MDAKKKRKLRKLGGCVTTVAEFLDLSEVEQAVIELRLELAAAVRKRRTAIRMTQAALAKYRSPQIGDQSRRGLLCDPWVAFVGSL